MPAARPSRPASIVAMGNLTFRASTRDDPAEDRALARLLRTSLLYGGPTDDDWERYGPTWPEHDLSFSAWDGATPVGHASAYPFTTLLPGGAWVPTCGVTRVATLPTHRRRGVLTELLGRVLDGARDRGWTVASLRASEGTIYGRFGFGLAGSGVTATVDARRARPVPPGAPGSFRLLDAADVLDVVPGIYDRSVHRVGAITRAPWLWKRYLADVLDPGEAHHVVVHTDEQGLDDGYAQYSVKWEGEIGTPDAGRGVVTEVRATSAAVERSLWGYLLDIDLVDRWTLEECPVDDLVFAIVADPRAAQVTSRYDEQWFRILDVDAFLMARSFTHGPAPVRIEVDDPRYDENCGTWTVDGEVTARTDDPADLVTDIAGLSAVSLGGVGWWELVASGRAEERSADAAARADALFAVRPLPFCGSQF